MVGGRDDGPLGLEALFSAGMGMTWLQPAPGRGQGLKGGCLAGGLEISDDEEHAEEEIDGGEDGEVGRRLMGRGEPIDDDGVGELLKDCDGHDGPVANRIRCDQQKQRLGKQGYGEESVEVFRMGDGGRSCHGDAITKEEDWRKNQESPDAGDAKDGFRHGGLKINC